MYMRLQNIYKRIKPKYILWFMIFIAILLIISYVYTWYKNRRDDKKDNDKKDKEKKESFTVAIPSNDTIKQIVISPKPGFSDNWLHFGSFQIFDNEDKQLLPTQYTVKSNTKPEIYNNNGYTKLSDNNANTMFHSGDKNCTLTFTLNNPTIISKIILIQRKNCCQYRLKGYKLVMKKVDGTTLSEIDLATLPALYNSPYADTITFTYPFQIVESKTAFKTEDKASTREMTSICSGSNCETAM